jgi:CPA2 family monovalent cation:H+ antiporter-2
MPPSLLLDLVLAYGVAVVAVLVLHRARVPTVVGFLAAGVVLGPHGLGLVRDPEAVGSLADIGVVILLFTIGVEMSVSRLLRMGAGLLVAGSVQMVLTGAGAALPVALWDGSATRAVVVGCLVAASSTTLLLRVLGERGELDAPQGRLGIAVSLFQDLCIVPILLLLPLLGGNGGSGAGDAALAVGRSALVIAATVVGSRLLVPRVLEAVVDARSRELFALTVIFLCVGTAYLAGLAGVSLALGAFLGGLVVSESPYSQQALGQLLPLRDGLAGLFFVGVGMLLDVGGVAAAPLVVLGAVAGILVLKVGATAVAVAFAGYGPRVAVLTGFALAPVSEFSFVVSRQAGARGLIDAATEQMFLAAAVLTMAAAPFLYRAAPAFAEAADRLARGRPPRRLAGAGPAVATEDHVIVVGYGLAGRNVAAALRANGIAFTAIEMNPETVRRERAAGTPILYGDAGHDEVLDRAGLSRARAVVVVISDAAGTRRVVEAAKRLRPDVRLVVRTRYVAEVGELKALGADEVVPEELETSVEIFARVLHGYRLPREAIERSVRSARAEAFGAVRPGAPLEQSGIRVAREMAHVDLETRVVEDGSPAAGRSIGALRIRKEHGVTVAGLRRAGQVMPDPDADTRLEPGDVVVVLGTPERLAAAASLFRAAGPAATPAPQDASRHDA